RFRAYAFTLGGLGGVCVVGRSKNSRAAAAGGSSQLGQSIVRGVGRSILDWRKLGETKSNRARLPYSSVLDSAQLAQRKAFLRPRADLLDATGQILANESAGEPKTGVMIHLVSGNQKMSGKPSPVSSRFDWTSYSYKRGPSIRYCYPSAFALLPVLLVATSRAPLPAS
uniref:Transpeptidase domain-containing protein n=1 Tax=Macrostomum lignano TaxID=282301 RepID=A0A1I8F647_9PLAT